MGRLTGNCLRAACSRADFKRLDLCRQVLALGAKGRFDVVIVDLAEGGKAYSNDFAQFYLNHGK
jgi:hypothetical protein